MATAARAGNREIIRFEPGKPETVSLKFSEGKEIAGQYGAQFMYSTTDDRIFFLDPEVARSLDDLQLSRGEEVRIGKTRRPKGGYDWDIERVRRPQAVPPAPPPPLAPLAPVAIAEPESARPLTPISAKFLAAYMVAVDVLQETQVYAQRKGLPLVITCEDVRCLAATMIINNDREGGR